MATTEGALPEEPSTDSGDLLRKALELRQDIRSARRRVDQATLEATAKRAERIPEVSFAVNTYSTVNLGGAFPSDLAFVGVQVNWDVFDWGRKRDEWHANLIATKQA